MCLQCLSKSNIFLCNSVTCSRIGLINTNASILKSSAQENYTDIRTVLQDGQFAALKEMEIFMILSLKNHHFWPFLSEKLSKIHKFGDFGCKNHQNLKKIQRPIIIP